MDNLNQLNKNNKNVLYVIKYKILNMYNVFYV